MSLYFNGLGRLAAVILIPGLIYTLRAGNAVPTTQLDLANGQKVVLLSQTSSSSGQGDQTLVVRYQTELSFDNPNASMTQEATRVFHKVLSETGSSSCSQIVVTANEVPQGMVLLTSRSRNFIFDRDGTGHWPTLPIQEPQE